MNGKRHRFCIVTYEVFPNPITQNLKTFLLENYNCDLLYIFHPQLDIKEGYQMSSGFNWFKDNKLIQSKNAYHWKAYWPLLYVKDIFYTLFWCLRVGKIDIYFAAGNLNPLVGIILKQFGVIKKVVYISMDYYPTRYENRFFNWLYFQLDKFCVRFADETWNVNSNMVSAREKKMEMDRKTYNRQYTVPGGIWFHKTKRLAFNKINRKKIVYRGSLLAHMGVDLAIKAMPYILKKDPLVKLEIIGGGEEEDNLKKLAEKLKILKSVVFHGWVKDRKQLEALLVDGALGIATFNTDILDEKIKNADPGKIKDYMLFGMPVITTNALYYHNEITRKKCGLVVEYKPEKLAEAVITLLSDKKLLEEYRENALKFIERFDCNNIFKPNVVRILNG
ncbi:MAG: glycosyltransferase [Candidatus Daviesbacteria bacterium]|nr:glycosyltransferase [Candidatus Daviesbacteria bacterium]